MGRYLLIARLALRDLRRRPFDAIMVVLVIGVAVTSLSVGSALQGVTDNPYRQTRAVTAGPDVVASFLYVDQRQPDPAVVDALAHAPGVTARNGPFPLAYTTMTAAGQSKNVAVEGRDAAPAAIDQPLTTAGGWVRPGEAVVERGFADSLGVRVGDTITLGGSPYRVGGTAVTSGLPAYPSNICHLGCAAPFAGPSSGGSPDVGLVWLTTPEVTALGSASSPLSYYMNLRLADPATAPAFVSAQREDPRTGGGPGMFLIAWQSLQDADNGLVQSEQLAMQVSGFLLAMLALAGVAVLGGRRMVDQTRRVGLLKAVGSSPTLIAGVLLAEHLLMAVVAAALGFVVGRLLSPSIASVGAGLVGSPGAPPLSVLDIAMPVAVAVAVAVLATLVPALRAARTSTVEALADRARPPRRRASIVAVSALLPVPLLLGLRLAARRPARSALNTLSVFVAVTGIVAIFATASKGLANRPVPVADRLSQLTEIITIMLVVVAAVNTLFIAWATITDARRMTALSRAFGATTRQIGAGMSAAQMLPALPGALVGIPAGLFLYRAVVQERTLTVPPVWELVVILAGALAAVAVLTAVPLRIASRQSVSTILQTEH